MVLTPAQISVELIKAVPRLSFQPFLIMHKYFPMNSNWERYTVYIHMPALLPSVRLYNEVRDLRVKLRAGLALVSQPWSADIGTTRNPAETSDK